MIKLSFKADADMFKVFGRLAQAAYPPLWTKQKLLENPDIDPLEIWQPVWPKPWPFKF
jgi:hypothetical protein